MDSEQKESASYVAWLSIIHLAIVLFCTNWRFVPNETTSTLSLGFSCGSCGIPLRLQSAAAESVSLVVCGTLDSYSTLLFHTFDPFTHNGYLALPLRARSYKTRLRLFDLQPLQSFVFSPTSHFNTRRTHASFQHPPGSRDALFIIL